MRTRRLLLATTVLTTALGACERPAPQGAPAPITPVSKVAPIETPPDAGVTPSDANVIVVPEIRVQYANTKGSLYDKGLAKPPAPK